MSSPHKIDAVLESVIQKGLKDSEHFPDTDYSDSDIVEDSPGR